MHCSKKGGVILEKTAINKNLYRGASNRVLSILCYVFVGGFALICLFPFALMITSSFMSEKKILEEGYKLIPDTWTISAYKFLLDNPKKMIDSYTEDPRRYTLNEEWEKVAIDNPYLGFQFDPKNITTEQSAISAVNSQLGVQIMLGKTGMDPKEAVAQYRQQLKDAGIEKVIDEVKAQLEDFTPIVGK